MICTVGTSSVTSIKAVKALLGSQYSHDEISAAILSDPEGSRDYELRAAAVDLMKHPENYENVLKCSGFGADFIFPSAEVQTIMRWLSETENIDELRIIFIPSQTEASILNAKVSIICLEKLHAIFHAIKLTCNEIIPLSIKVDTRENFLASISELFGEFDKLILNKANDEQAIICSTGGYKAVSGFAMMYSQLHSLPCLYSFEGHSTAYEVMSIPLGYAYSSLDEEINMLKAIHRNAEVDVSSLPQWVKDSGKFTGTLLKSYYSAREKPYGTGEDLFRRLRACPGGEEWADYLQSLLVQKWADIWSGDLIPETVEHSRRHSKRLMELAANFLRCLGRENYNSEFLALLIAAIYLHDIGHTALSYPVVINDDNDFFPLGLFPSVVREMHHLLTGEILASEPERFFANEKFPEQRKILERYVPLIAAHHRGYTVLKKGEKVNLSDKKLIMKIGTLIFGHEKFHETLMPLEERIHEKFHETLSSLEGSIHERHFKQYTFGQEKFYEASSSHINELLTVTALLRLLDGCDIQADRVISENYLQYRTQRSNDEANLIFAEIKNYMKVLPVQLKYEIMTLQENRTVGNCRKVYSLVFDVLTELKAKNKTWRSLQIMPEFIALSLADRLAFKLEQHLHFRKHQCTSFVMPVMNYEANKIMIEVFPNYDMKDIEDKMLEEIVKNINCEYEAVKNVLSEFPEFEAELVKE